MARPRVTALSLLASVAVTGACATQVPSTAAPEATSPATAITGDAAPEVATTATPVPSAPVSSTVPAPTTTATTRVRAVALSSFSPFATVGPVMLFHPAANVERVGFHESNDDGARQQVPLPTAIAPVTVESRDRGTGAQTAADVVVAPGGEIRAPVTGRVKRAGGYVLYCKYSDDYVVIEPDARPGWEVKILHVDRERVSAGQRVTAGQTVIAAGPTQLPFESQVDELRSVDPAWPHVHIEVVDPAIPDRPSPGGGCS